MKLHAVAPGGPPEGHCEVGGLSAGRVAAPRREPREGRGDMLHDYCQPLPYKKPNSPDDSVVQFESLAQPIVPLDAHASLLTVEPRNPSTIPWNYAVKLASHSDYSSVVTSKAPI